MWPFAISTAATCFVFLINEVIGSVVWNQNQSSGSARVVV